MNQIVPIIAQRRSAVLTAERRAFLRLVTQQRRLSWQYRRWALEDAEAGNITAYRKHLAEAERLRRDAHWHLDRAREAQHGA